MIQGPFLYPQHFPGHQCQWQCFSYAQAGCLLCGAEHTCKEHGTCEEEKSDEGHTTCRITGCVIREHEFRNEWGALGRTCPLTCTNNSNQAHTGRENVTTHKKNTQQNPCNTRDFVNTVVKELLDSQTTRHCRAIENKRFFQTQINTLHKALKNHKSKEQFRLPAIVTQIAWSVRKMRHPVSLPRDEMCTLITLCTDAITFVMLKYNSNNTVKLINNDIRRKEFACSMLYLMRSGVVCRGQPILPRLPIIAALLPLEIFLPEHFGIRSKSITEGENLLKMEIRRINAMP
eukprot:3747689-Rhodomonas_salina.1